METLATLAMDVRVPKADEATASLKAMKVAARGVEEQFNKTSAAQRDAAVAQGLSGTAAGQAEKSMKALTAVYGQARDSLGRFAQEDGKYRASQEATALMLIRNAQAQAALAKEQEKAAKETAALARQYDILRASLDPFAAVQQTLAQRTKLLDDAMAKGVISAGQHADALSRATRAATSELMAIDNLTKGHATAVGGSKNLTYAMLNLSRQASDLGVGFAGAATSGKPLQMVFMTLVQQTPQVVDIFAQLKAEGVGAKAAIGQMATAARGLIVTFAPWIAGAVAVGAAVYLLNKRHEEQTKRLKALSKEVDEFNKKVFETAPTLNTLTNQTDLAQIGTANFTEYLRKGREQMDGYAESVRKATIELWKKNVAEAQGRVDAAKSAVKDNPAPAALFVNSMGKASQWANSKEIKLAADATKLLGEATTGLTHAKSMLSAMEKTTDLKAFTGETNKAAKATREHKEAITGNALELVGLGDDVLTFIRALEKQNAEAGLSAEALKDLEFRTALLGVTNDDVRQRMVSAYDAYKMQAKFAKDFAEGQKIAGAAANENIKTFEEQTRGLVRFSDWLERATFDLEDAAATSRGLSYDIDDIAHAINGNDWTSAFAGMARVLMQVKAAFDQGATSAQKYAAAAGVAQAVGGAVGGTGGAAISGAASGAMAGFTIAGPAGAVVGGILGGIGGILGSSKAKKRQRQQEAAQRAQEAAQREQTINDTYFAIDVATLHAQGKEQQAVTKEREKEAAALRALSPALAEAQIAYWAIADAAEKAANIEARRVSIQDQIDQLTLSSAELTAKAHAKEKAEAEALSPALGELVDKLYGLRAAAVTTARIAEIASQMVSGAEERVASARSALQDAYDAEKARLTGIVDAAQAAASMVETATSNVRSAYESQASTIGSTIDRLNAYSQSMRDFGKSLMTGDLSAATSAQRYAASRAEFERVRGLALGGDVTAQGQYQSVAQEFLKASADNSSTALGYLSDLGQVKDATDILGKTASAQVGVAEQQLAQLKAQVGAVIDLGADVRSVDRAISDLQTARLASAQADAAAAAAKEELVRLDQQVSGLLQINTSVLSVKDTVAGLNSAILALANAKAAQESGKGWTSPTVPGGVAVPSAPSLENPYTDNNGLMGLEGMVGRNAKGEVTIGGFTAAELAAGKDNPYALGGGDATAIAIAIAGMKKLYGPDVLPGFAKGGAFKIAGAAGIDQNLLSINGQPAARVGQGEIVTITPPGGVANDNGMGAVVAELRALRQSNADLKKQLEAMQTDNRIGTVSTVKAINRQTETLEKWDEEGLPVDRVEPAA